MKVRQRHAGGEGATTVTLNGVVQEGSEISLVDDRGEHFVEVMMA